MIYKRPGTKFIAVLKSDEVVLFVEDRNIVTNQRILDLDIIEKQIPGAPKEPPTL